MPFSITDVKKHNKDLDADQAQVWVRVANDVLKRCENEGGEDCEGSAIRQANAVAERSGKTLTLSMAITKVSRMKDGHVRFRGRANSGGKDSLEERLDATLFDDFVDNFMRVQEAQSRGETVKDMNPVQLDVAHYSFFAKDRAVARAGWPYRMWRDGKALMVQGWFDETPIGQAAAKAVMNDHQKHIRLSVGFYPDWGNVGTEDGVLVYRGGRGVAYLDHIALTAHPVDADTDITALEVTMSDGTLTMKDDAQEVLGDEELVGQLEAAAKSETVPAGAVIKAEEAEDVATEDAEDAASAKEALEAHEAGETLDLEEVKKELEDASDNVTESRLKSVVTDLFGAIKAEMAGLGERIKALDTKVDALAVEEGVKVKAAIDNDGDWLTPLLRGTTQRSRTTVKGVEGEHETIKGPKQATPGTSKLDQGVAGAIFGQS